MTSVAAARKRKYDERKLIAALKDPDEPPKEATLIALAQTKTPYRQRLTIRVPDGEPWEPTKAVRLVSQLFGCGQPFNLGIRATQNSIFWYIDIGSDGEASVNRTVYTLYPTAELTSEAQQHFDEGYHLFQGEAANPYIFPFKKADSFTKGMSPLAPLVSVLGTLQMEEAVVYEIALRHPRDGMNYRKLGEELLYVGKQQQALYVAEVQKPAAQKLNTPLMEARLSVKMKAPAPRIEELMNQLVSPLTQFDFEYGNQLGGAHPNHFHLVPRRG